MKNHKLIFDECIFIPKENMWPVENMEVKLVSLLPIDTNQKYDKKFNKNIALMGGLSKDGQYVESICPLNLFEIYDKYGNEISELTLSQYNSIVRNKKIDKCLGDLIILKINSQETEN